MKKKTIVVIGISSMMLLAGMGSVAALDIFGLFKIARNWDVNLDCTCDYMDTGSTGLVYGSDPYDGREDVNGDGIVNYLDTGELALHYGESY